MLTVVVYVVVTTVVRVAGAKENWPMVAQVLLAVQSARCPVMKRRSIRSQPPDPAKKLRRGSAGRWQHM